MRGLAPIQWCGRFETVEQEQVFVCGACPDPGSCATEDACARHLAAPGRCGCPPSCSVCAEGTR